MAENRSLRIPESIIESAEYVVEQARDVYVDRSALSYIAKPIMDRLAGGIDSVEDAFGSTGELESDINLVYFETAVNFCFWSGEPNEKWQVKSHGRKLGGWYGLARAFHKAIKRGMPVHDAEFMENLTLDQAANIFTGVDGRMIPLFEHRVSNIVEAASFLNDRYHGKAVDFLEEHEYSAPRIAEAVAKQIPSYRDGALYAGKWAWILKRAQILPSDLSQLSSKYPKFQIHDTDQLTVFADYRLPQLLRHFDVLKYSDDLSWRIDNKRFLPSQSSEEVEIRMSTVYACEQLKNECPDLKSSDIDLGLWLLGQDMRNDPQLKPHHLTPGIFY